MYSGGCISISLALLFLILSEIFSIASFFWLQRWGDESSDNKDLSTEKTYRYLAIYAAIGAVSIILQGIKNVFTVIHASHASSNMHDHLFRGIMETSISFFDHTPMGRILNRFSADLEVIDLGISLAYNFFVTECVHFLGALVAITAASKGILLLVIIPLTFLYRRIQSHYKTALINIRRYENVSRSPVVADFNQTLSGLPIIRSYGLQNIMISRLNERLMEYTVSSQYTQLLQNWFHIRLTLIGSLLSVSMGIIAVAWKGFIPPGFVAVGLTFSLIIPQLLLGVFQNQAQLEGDMDSLTRIKEYSVLEREDGLFQGILLPEGWPNHGKIEMIDVSLSYRSGPLILKGLSFTAPGGSKVGIVGRTGSGKSTTLVALFRMEKIVSGTILIDGVDISKIPLKTLRSTLGIIPQDPVVFSFTVRFNLDPFSEHTDQDLWEALEKVNLKNFISDLPKKLEEKVQEGGENFSVGQRQLICIARALLRNPKILVLDEVG